MARWDGFVDEYGYVFETKHAGSTQIGRVSRGHRGWTARLPKGDLVGDQYSTRQEAIDALMAKLRAFRGQARAMRKKLDPEVMEWLRPHRRRRRNPAPFPGPPPPAPPPPRVIGRRPRGSRKNPSSDWEDFEDDSGYHVYTYKPTGMSIKVWHDDIAHAAFVARDWHGGQGSLLYALGSGDFSAETIMGATSELSRAISQSDDDEAVLEAESALDDLMKLEDALANLET